jgi:hypothetical protein
MKNTQVIPDRSRKIDASFRESIQNYRLETIFLHYPISGQQTIIQTLIVLKQAVRYIFLANWGVFRVYHSPQGHSNFSEYLYLCKT